MTGTRPGGPKQVMWQFLDGPGVELLELEEAGDSVVAESVIVRSLTGSPFTVRYRIECDSGWRVRMLRVDVASGKRRTLTWHADGVGVWKDDDGEIVAGITGCIDVDLSATAFTNTLPIRRLDLQPGEQETIAAAYVHVPELTFDRSIQRYTRLERDPAGARYRYESLKDGEVGYSTEITVDGDGLVVEYPGYARRVSG